MKNNLLSNKYATKELNKKKMGEYRAPEALVVGKASELLQGGYCSHWDQSDYSSCTSPNPR